MLGMSVMFDKAVSKVALISEYIEAITGTYP